MRTTPSSPKRTGRVKRKRTTAVPRLPLRRHLADAPRLGRTRAPVRPVRPPSPWLNANGSSAPLILLFAPLLTSLLLIGAGAILQILKIDLPWLQLLGEPVIALLIGLIGTCLVTRSAIGQKRVEEAIAVGFKESGQILILTGVGGSLAATVAAAGLGHILGGFFSASTVAPLLVVWAIAAVLHIAVGSVTLSAITAAGLLAPIAPVIGLDPVLLALSAGAGSLFMVHVTSNTFWLLQSLLGQSVRGALKSVTVGVSVASVVAILLILPMSLLF
jgi:GntP family gluconate:H+ symporter